jgi:pseudaminic acid cytidylyltransferase
MIAYIPARGGSKRIPRKNIKKLDGRPIIAHVIENLNQLSCISQICVSTDDEEIRKIAERCGAMTLDLRDPTLSGDHITFMDLIRGDIPRFTTVNHSKEILFVLPTAALIPPKLYECAYQRYMEKSSQVLMAGTAYPISPYWGLTQKDNGYWKPLFPEAMLVNSQDLPATTVDAGLFYLFNYDDVKDQHSLQFVENLDIIRIPSKYVVDVDTPDDWEELESKYEKLNRESER